MVLRNDNLEINIEEVTILSHLVGRELQQNEGSRLLKTLWQKLGVIEKRLFDGDGR